jgi:hypothetical protein
MTATTQTPFYAGVLIDLKNIPTTWTCVLGSLAAVAVTALARDLREGDQRRLEVISPQHT